jgi:UDP-N-acetylglucosamine--N-acetylmuramyl-(pentapeptide) pyrophosphoryl-undecaprenol N-acetylglucosamine transferase
MDASNLHIVFSGGGTGGHLFPGIAVADELRRLLPTARITFVGRGSAFERDEVEKAGYAFMGIAARPLPRKAWQTVGFIANQMACAREASAFLKQAQPSIVVGLGGYASVPVARAAASQGVPLVLLEQNVAAGRANRWLAPSAALIFAACEVTPAWKCTCPVRLVGNPVRRGFIHRSLRRDAPEIASPTHERRLVVLGGSQGAKTLNEQLPRALYKVGAIAHQWQIIHQSGAQDVELVRELYRKLGLRAYVQPFLHDLPSVLGATDLVVSRAGGTTLAELAASAVPALLVPYPHATGNHQRKNADRFVAAGAARMIDPREVTGRLDNRLAEVLRDLMTDGTARVAMTGAMRRLARPGAARDIAQAVCELIGAPTLRRAS